MRTLRCCIVVVTVAFLAGACGSTRSTDAGPKSTEPVGTGRELTGTATRLIAEPGAAAPLAHALDGFGGALYGSVAKANPGRNTAISPYSVAAALLMVRTGARGETRTEIDRALTLMGIDVDAGFDALDQALLSRAGTFTGPDGSSKQLVLSTANALWAQDGYPVEPPFLDTLAAHYGAGLHTVDFAQHPEVSRRQINEWVSDRTNAKIPELLGPDFVKPDTVLVLTNALYLNAPWAVPFSSSAGSDADFTRRDGSKVSARMMYQTTRCNYAEDDSWQVVELPYVGNQLAMDVIVPRPGKFDAVERQATEDIGRFVDGLAVTPVQLTLPKFSFRTTTDLIPPLRSLGITRLFAGADLSGMGPGGLEVTDAVHEAYVAITEQGTEAAAATAFGMAASGYAKPPPEVRADRPFLFLIRDVETGAVLMLGRVLDPTQA
jgi:serpin B